MEEIQGAFSEGMECPNCGWGWVTTNIGSIADDNTDYEIWLQPGIQATEQWNVRTHSQITFVWKTPDKFQPLESSGVIFYLY